MKKLLCIVLAIVICFGTAACVKDDKIDEPEKEIKQQEIDSNATENTENANVEIKDNKIYNTVKGDDGSVTVQEYVYTEEDILSDINVTIKLPDEKAAKEMYESITNGELKVEYESKYDNIKLNDNIISAEMKDENVESMSVLNQEQMYLILGSNITTYNLTE